MPLRFSHLSFFLLVLVAAVHSQDSSDDSRWSVKRLVEFHQQQHPDLMAQDVYKLLYQASFGVEHILSDSAAVLSYLNEELSTVDTPQPNEALMERISLENDVVRVNLRRFKALNLEPSLLVQAMVRSAKATSPDTLMFHRQWNEFSALVRFELLPFSAEDLRTWDTKVEGGAVEAVHHSEKYVAANRPAYRVVKKDAFEEAFGRTR